MSSLAGFGLVAVTWVLWAAWYFLVYMFSAFAFATTLTQSIVTNIWTIFGGLALAPFVIYLFVRGVQVLFFSASLTDIVKRDLWYAIVPALLCTLLFVISLRGQIAESLSMQK